MTEILLKVTNREIANICKEELQRHLRKTRGIVFNSSCMIVDIDYITTIPSLYFIFKFVIV